MALMQDIEILKILQEITANPEVIRKAQARRRHDMYKDDGTKFLIEQIKNEFGAKAIPEMRLAPLNVLSKIVKKKSVIYRTPPIRKTSSGDADQKLVDFYVTELEIDAGMMKGNRFYNLFSNTGLYCWPGCLNKDGVADFLKFMVIPSYLYSLVPDPFDPTVIKKVVMSEFTEYAGVIANSYQQSATGVQGFNRDPGMKNPGTSVDSAQPAMPGDPNRRFIWWTDDEHFTTNIRGEKILLSDQSYQDNNTQFMNSAGILPIVNLAKDRDCETWSTQGADLFDSCLAFAIGWTDLLTIAKHQGFAQPVITSPEMPEEIQVGVNKVLWLKQSPDGTGPTPTFGFASAGSPLNEYKDVLMDFLGLILTSNDLNPGAVSGNRQSSDMSSGFSRLIEMSDALEAIEADKPVLRDAELNLWDVIKAWHNDMYERGVLREDAKKLGRFSDKFELSIQFRDIRPIESETDRITAAKAYLDMGIATKQMALKKLQPDLSDDQADKILSEVDAEKQANLAKFGSPFLTDEENVQASNNPAPAPVQATANSSAPKQPVPFNAPKKPILNVQTPGKV